MSQGSHTPALTPDQSMATCRVTLRQTGETYACGTGETLLQGMLKLGRRGIPVGCVNGGCGVCKVKVIRGRCRGTGAISRQHVTVEEEERGITLACRVIPQGDVELEVIGRMQRGFVNLIVSSGSAIG